MLWNMANWESLWCQVGKLLEWTLSQLVSERIYSSPEAEVATCLQLIAISLSQHAALKQCLQTMKKGWYLYVLRPNASCGSYAKSRLLTRTRWESLLSLKEHAERISWWWNYPCGFFDERPLQRLLELHAISRWNKASNLTATVLLKSWGMRLEKCNPCQILWIQGFTIHNPKYNPKFLF